jgi:hypothetical protein
LCAGLAAAHEKGVLHRDLKPGNIMIDGRGEVLITDFGLAAISGSVSGVEARQGTPAYMAPEQLAGREASVRSDLYALGLVLYEMFTGKRAFEARSVAELERMQQETAPASLTAVAREVDPATERAILRCLAHDPKQRPASAKAVALALPGGDPLAAAIAAGETPSPEMVANAEESEGIRPGVGAALFAFVVLGAIAAILLMQSSSLMSLMPFEYSPEALAAMARDHARHFGYPQRAGGSAMGLEGAGNYLEYARKHFDRAHFYAQLRLRPPCRHQFLVSAKPRSAGSGCRRGMGHVRSSSRRARRHVPDAPRPGGPAAVLRGGSARSRAGRGGRRRSRLAALFRRRGPGCVPASGRGAGTDAGDGIRFPGGVDGHVAERSRSPDPRRSGRLARQGREFQGDLPLDEVGTRRRATAGVG